MKYLTVFSDSLAAQDLARQVKEKHLQVTDDPQQADAIIVGGGDGTMLHAIHQYWQLKVPFLGINCGSVGFLLNPVETERDLLLLLHHFQEVKLNLMEVHIDAESDSFTLHAFNDVYLNVKPGSICYGTIQGEHYPRQKFRGDGLIVATGQGSTAYNRNAGGSILPLQNDLLAITGICTYDTLRDVVSQQDLIITITRGEVTANADNQSVAGVRSIVIRPGFSTVALGFRPDYNFESKRYSFYNQF
ncbi:MAG: NAD(+)/NADH kinase [Candidatus Falkowbacteria bacterium]